uniref:BPTI/Kunitz inhibitor domain-containing protein n=1 Tax=Pseudonaja textilis TaxID=8673 RepID=A0A670YNB1_PSETE
YSSGTIPFLLGFYSVLELSQLFMKSVKTCLFLPHKCKLPPKKGRCNEDFENFYYDHNSNMCKTFIFGGCGGNANNFQTFDQCNKACDAFGTLKQFYIPLPRIN